MLQATTKLPSRVQPVITRHFVGRAKELLEIHRAFNTPCDANRPARYALCGPGGVGKSQLALQYAERAYAQGRYLHVFYITASTAGHIRDGLAHILCLVQKPDYTRTKSGGAGGPAVAGQCGPCHRMAADCRPCRAGFG
ncbi:hypothetical protein FIBSPDRAFT_860739 [Athelia psychrophila]|uniref:Orc1-like AAA ATPase domain-containing protein n=1 Tax=Athelia psychrophila TaxID=1759441 RepID=A0A166JWH8_9AGAM|nr:hypothetical protein FIBSPDRAFT_860739 [Fibularhizoctonia sp. CBS 109695]